MPCEITVLWHLIINSSVYNTNLEPSQAGLDCDQKCGNSSPWEHCVPYHCGNRLSILTIHYLHIHSTYYNTIRTEVGHPTEEMRVLYPWITYKFC